MTAPTNECQFRATTGGVTDFVVGQAIVGFFKPAQCTSPAIVDGGLYYWRAESDDLSQHELFQGVYTAGTTTVARTTTLQSSNGGSKVNFPSAPIVRMVAPSQLLPGLSTPIPSGATHLWPLDNANVSGTTLTDTIAGLNATAGSSVAPTTGPGLPTTTARIFPNDANGYATLAGAPIADLTKDWSIGFWVRRDDNTIGTYDGGDPRCINFNDTVNNFRTVVSFFERNDISFIGQVIITVDSWQPDNVTPAVGAPSAKYAAQAINGGLGDITLFSGEYTHFAITHAAGSSTAVIYINGQSVVVGAGAGDGSHAGNAFGARDVGNRPLGGAMAQIVVYPRVLSADDVTQLYNNLSGPVRPGGGNFPLGTDPTVAGGNRDLQFNNNGRFGGSYRATFNGSYFLVRQVNWPPPDPFVLGGTSFQAVGGDLGNTVYFELLSFNAGLGSTNLGSAFIGRPAEGTNESPTGILSGLKEFRIGVAPYGADGGDGASWVQSATAAIDFIASENCVRDFNEGTQIDFKVTKNATGNGAKFTSVSFDNTGEIVTKFGRADQSYSYQTPVNAFSIVVGNQIETLILNPAGALAAGTITMPTTPLDGQILRIKSSRTITALTLTANAGQSMGAGAPTTIIGGTLIDLQFRSANTTWY